MSDYRCPDGRHRFAKFDDTTIFCERCGEQRVMDVQAFIAKLPPITCLPCPGPHYPQPTWWTLPTWSPTIVWSNSTSSTFQPNTDVVLG